MLLSRIRFIKIILIGFIFLIICTKNSQAETYYIQSGNHPPVKQKVKFSPKIIFGHKETQMGSSSFERTLPGTTSISPVCAQTTLFFEIPIPEYVGIVCGEGMIKIYFNGKVELDNTNINEDAKEFWDKIAVIYPVCKQTIINEYIKSLPINK